MSTVVILWPCRWEVTFQWYWRSVSKQMHLCVIVCFRNYIFHHISSWQLLSVTGGHLSLPMMKYMCDDFITFTFINHFSTHFWISFKLLCKFCEVEATSIYAAESTILSTNIVVIIRQMLIDMQYTWSKVLVLVWFLGGLQNWFGEDLYFFDEYETNIIYLCLMD